MKSWFTVDTTKLIKLCVNTANQKELRSHPYLDNKKSQLLSRFIENNSITSLEEVSSQPYMTTEVWVKPNPCLKICNIE